MAIDQRTLAFREWIAAILAKQRINKTELAKRAGLSHSTLSRAMTDDDHVINFRADTIARLAEVGGIKPPASAMGLAESDAGFSETDAAPLTFEDEPLLTSNQSTWTVRTNALSSIGLMPGDKFVLDQSLKPQSHDVVMVQRYDHQAGTAETLLRMYMEGFAVTPMYLVDRSPKLWIDGNNVVIMGVVSKSWRTRN